MVRLTVTPSWARWDSRFTGNGDVEPLGAVLTSDALGTAQLPGFTLLESALRSLTGNPDFRLSLGRATTHASIRVVTTPISLEYGVTRRLSLGVTVPIVQRQRELLLDLTAVADGNSTPGNVGPTAAGIDPAVYTQAARIADEIDAAAAELAQRITQCDANPAAAGCAAIVADRAGAAATVQEGTQVAFSIRYIYGTSAATPGIGLVPLTEQAQALALRLQALNARFASFLGGTPIPTQTPPRGAAGPVAAGDFRSLMRSGVAGMGPDSLGRISRIGLGDIEVGAKLLLWDSRPPTPGDSGEPTGFRVRAIAGALARFATGLPPNDNELFAIGTGDGQPDAEASLAVDLESGRGPGATLIARYTAQLGSVAATRLPDPDGSLTPFGASGVGTRELGDILSLEVSPRYWLGHSLFIAAHYGLIARGSDRYTFVQGEPRGDVPPLPTVPPLPAQAMVKGFTEQRAGFGIVYTTYAEWERGRVRVPIEVSYTHLETVAGTSAWVPRAGRDQVQLRIYYRLRR